MVRKAHVHQFVRIRRTRPGSCPASALRYPDGTASSSAPATADRAPNRSRSASSRRPRHRRRSAAARRRRDSPDRSPPRPPRGGNRARSAPRGGRRSSAASAPARCEASVAPSLRISSSAYSSRSKDFITAGSRCCPGLGQHQCMRTALEQLRTDQFLERDHVPRQRALRYQQRVGRRGEAQVLRNAFECAQCVQRQPAAIDGCLAHDGLLMATRTWYSRWRASDRRRSFWKPDTSDKPPKIRSAPGTSSARRSEAASVA